jgi:hypothetical protein
MKNNRHCLAYKGAQYCLILGNTVHLFEEKVPGYTSYMAQVIALYQQLLCLQHIRLMQLTKIFFMLAHILIFKMAKIYLKPTLLPYQVFKLSIPLQQQC